MKKETKQKKEVPFFARYLEGQDLTRVRARYLEAQDLTRVRGARTDVTMKYPSDDDESTI